MNSINKLKYFIPRTLVILCFVTMGSLLSGCGGNPPLSNLNPEDGSTSNDKPVTFSAIYLDVVLNLFQIQGQPTTIKCIPFNATWQPDKDNIYTYTFNSDDIYADLPSGSANGGGTSNSHPTTSNSNVTGTATYKQECPFPFICVAPKFHSIPKHSPVVHLMVSGTTTLSNGQMNNIGPATASSYMWYFAAPPGLKSIENTDTLNSAANDFIISTTGISNFCSLPNPIVDPITLKPITNLNIKVFNGLHVASGSLAAIGPWYGGSDSNLPCFSSFSGVCDNYWNGDILGCKNQFLSGCNVPNNTYGCIGLSQGIWNALDEDNAIHNHPKDAKGDAVNGQVDWRFQ